MHLKSYPTIEECVARVATASANFQRVYAQIQARFGHARTVYMEMDRVHAGWGDTHPDGRQYMGAHTVHLDDRQRDTVLSGTATSKGTRGLIVLRAPEGAPMYALVSSWTPGGIVSQPIELDGLLEEIDTELCLAFRAERERSRYHPERCVRVDARCNDTIRGPATVRLDVQRVSADLLSRDD